MPARCGHRAAALPTAIRAARTGGDFVNSYATSARARRGRDPRRREPGGDLGRRPPGGSHRRGSGRCGWRPAAARRSNADVSTDAPELSVVLAGLADAAVLETTLLHLRAQTVRENIEVIVVAPSVERLGALPVTMDEMHSCRVIEVPSAITSCEANAAGARAAAAPIVAFAEDHSYVDPQWGAALLDAHQGDWAAVGPEVGNANPDTMTSWADFVMSYGPWMEPAEARPAAVPPRPQLQLQARRAARRRRRARRASSSPRPCSTTGSPPPGTGSTSSLVPASRTSTSRAGRSRSASSSTPGACTRPHSARAGARPERRSTRSPRR